MAKDHFSGVSEQKRASTHRIKDAEVLREGKRYLGAMYLAGYAVECLLKAKLMERFRCRNLMNLEMYLRSKRLMRSVDTAFSHQIYFLLRLTGAMDRLKMNPDAWRAFATVNQWVPAWRYSPLERKQPEADNFFSSVHTVMHWIEVNT